MNLDLTEEIVDIFLEHAFDSNETVGLISHKETINYALDCVLSCDGVSIRKVDLELDNDTEYMISIDNDGNIVVQPIVEYDDKYFTDIKHAYISMDGDISQATIDNCLDRDVDVILFGYDEEDEYDCEKCECPCKDTQDSESVYISRSKDGTPEGFSKSWSTTNNGVTCYSSYSHYTNNIDSLRTIAKVFGVEL